MISWSRVDKDGNEQLIKQFDTIEQFDAYMNGTKDPEKEDIPNGCWNCLNFDWRHEACTLRWNNMDEDYYRPDLDDRELTDYCDDHELDPDADPECLEFGGNEP